MSKDSGYKVIIMLLAIFVTVSVISISLKNSSHIGINNRLDNFVDIVGKNILATSGSTSSSSSGNPCKNRACCGGVPYSGSKRCCNGVIYDSGYTTTQNPDGSTGSRRNVCCGGNIVEIGNDSRYTGTLCCQNLGQVKEYNRSHWVWGPTGVGRLDPNKACGGCANQPNPPRADYCVQYNSNSAYMIRTPWNNQTCRYDRPIWTPCGQVSRCSSDGKTCQ